MSVVAATILCDRKASSQLIAPPAVLQMAGVDRYYINVETALTGEERDRQWAPLLALLASRRNRQPTVHLEWWYRSGWGGAQPTYDQDQRRLKYIITARNMAIDFALAMRADWLLYIDADVIPKPDGLQYLMALGKPLCGGLVPGRGAHSHVKYIFHHHATQGDVITCGYGTCGYMLISKDIFGVLRFRMGPHMQHRDVFLSEDPAYCADAIQTLKLADDFYISTLATAEHWDDPDRPMTTEQAFQPGQGGVTWG